MLELPKGPPTSAYKRPPSSDVHASHMAGPNFLKKLDFKIEWRFPPKVKRIWPCAHGFTGFASQHNTDD